MKDCIHRTTTFLLIESIEHSSILVTGGSGLVGSGLIRALHSSQPDRQIVVLSRRPEAGKICRKAAIIKADLREPELGIERAAYRLLQGRVTEIIHCAADLKFTASLESARATNVEGTRRVLDFAQGCPNLQRVAHISTLYIAGRRHGTVSEEPLQHDYGYFNVYEKSKHEAEHLVVNRMRDLPISIYRLSSIIGHSATGEASQQNYFHNLIRLLPRADEIREIPGDPEAPVDLIPDDWCVAALACLFQRHFRASRIHHLCAGLEQSLRAAELLELIFRIYNATAAEPVPKPRLKRFPAPPNCETKPKNGSEGKLKDVLSTFLPHLAICQPFDRGTTGTILTENGIELPAVNDFIARIVRRLVTAMDGSATS